MLDVLADKFEYPVTHRKNRVQILRQQRACKLRSTYMRPKITSSISLCVNIMLVDLWSAMYCLPQLGIIIIKKAIITINKVRNN